MNEWFDIKELEEEWIDKPVKEAKKKMVVDFMEAITRPTQTRETYKTPVLTGALMANTFLSVGSPSSNTLASTDRDGTNTFMRALNKYSQADTYDDIYIQNNLDYAVQANEEGWDFKTVTVPPYYFWNNAITYTISEMEKS